MPDVDSCTRWAEMGLCENAGEYANRIAELPDRQRVMLFRNKDALEIEGLLRKFRESIIAQICEDYDVLDPDNVGLSPSSNNNRVEADLIGIINGVPRINIEVKFGNKTDHAMGMGKFNEIFGVDPYGDVLSSRRSEWRNMYVEEQHLGLGDASQQARLLDALNSATKLFNDRMCERGYRLTEQGAMVMEQYLLNNSGARIDGRDYMMFGVNEVTLEMEKQGVRPAGAGVWRVDGEQIKEISSGERVNIVLTNDVTGIKVRFVHNFKNNYTISLGEESIKAQAKLGLGCLSWNVWID